MQISASLINKKNVNAVVLKTDTHTHSISIPPQKNGFGSSAGGGELLFLALASCYCNDIYREAGRQGIEIESVEIEVEGELDSDNLSESNILYSASVKAKAKREVIIELINLTDKVTEIHKTLRAGVPVTLVNAEAVSTA